LASTVLDEQVLQKSIDQQVFDKKSRRSPNVEFINMGNDQQFALTIIFIADLQSVIKIKSMI